MAVKETLRYVITAEDKELLDALKRVAAGIKRTGDETKKAGDDSAARDRARTEASARYLQQLEREVAFVTRATKEQQALWEVEKGRYKDLDAASKQRVVQLAKEADQAKAAAVAAQQAAAAQAQAVREGAASVAATNAAAERALQGGGAIARLNPFAQAHAGFKEFFAGANGEVGKLSNALKGVGSIASTAVGAIGAIAGGPVTAGLAALALAVNLVTTKIEEKKKAAEEAEAALVERTEASARALDAEREALSKVIERERALQTARREGISEEAAARRLTRKQLEREAPNRQAEAAEATASVAALQARLVEEKRLRTEALAEAARNEEMYRAANIEGLDEESRARAAILTEQIGRTTEEFGRALTAETTAVEAAEKTKIALRRAAEEDRVAAELKAIERIEQAKQDRKSARASLLALDVEERALRIAERGVSAAVARAHAELQYADQLIKTKDAQAKALELEAMRRKAAAAEAADLRTKAETVKSTLEGLDREIALSGLQTEAERARWETEKGRYKDWSEAAKAAYVLRVGELEQIRATTAAEKERLAQQASAASKQQGDQIKAAAEEEAALTKAANEAQQAASKATADVLKKNGENAKRIAKEGKDELQQLANLAQSVASSFGDTLIDSFFEPQKSGWEEWSKNVAKQIAKVTLQLLAMRALSAFAPGGDGAAGVLGKVLGFSGGGSVHGPGTGTSDSIPARLSDGEYVVRAAAVDRYGVGLLDAINGIRLPRPQGFASGGLVRAPAAQAPQVGVRIINNFDPALVTDVMNSSEGEQVFLNWVSRNPDRLRGAMGG